MSWAKPLALVTLFAVLLGGCATGPGKGGAGSGASGADPDLQKAFDEAVSLMEAGNTEDARSRFQELAKAHPERTGPLANLGVLAYQAGNPDEARGYFEAVIILDPGHKTALNYLGVIARLNGDFEQAETYYRKALEADPDYLPAMLNLGILLDIYLGRPEEAIPLYEQYQALAPDLQPGLEDWIFDAKNRVQ